MHRISSRAIIIALLSATLFTSQCTTEVIEITLLRIEVISTGNDFSEQHDLCFGDVNSGMLVSRSKVYGTNNGSATSWNQYYSALNSTREVTCIEHPTANFAIIAERNPSDQNRHTFFYTNNGGMTWYTGAYVGMLYKMSFYSPTEGYYIGNNSFLNPPNSLWYTSDGGLTWQIRSAAISIPDMLQFVDYNRGFHFNRPLLHTTNDAGLTWQQISSDAYCVSDFLPDGTGYKVLSGNQQNILKSIDFGATWTTVVNNTAGAYFYDIDCHSNGLVVAVGINRILVSRDYGLTWEYPTYTSHFNDSFFNEVEILDASHFVILGNSGNTDFIYRVSIL